MLGKLIKYEFKALYKKILLCVVGGLLISLLTLLLFQLAVASNGILCFSFFGAAV